MRSRNSEERAQSDRETAAILSAANPGTEPCRALAKATGGLAGPLTFAADRATNAASTLFPDPRRSEGPRKGASAWRSLRSPHTVSHSALTRAPLSFPDTLSPRDNWTNRHIPQNRCDRDDRNNWHRPYHRNLGVSAAKWRLATEATSQRAFKSEVRLKRLCGRKRLARL